MTYTNKYGEKIYSVDYLAQMRHDACLSKSELLDILDNIGYILTDNGFNNARSFLDDLAALVDDDEIPTL